MDFERYRECLNLNTKAEILATFYRTLVETNRDHKFFVDWNKVKEKVNTYKIEFNILNSLIGSNDFNKDLKYILSEYPNVIPAIPILVAIRNIKLKVIADFSNANSDMIDYDFTKRKLTDYELEKFITFFNDSGLKYFFKELSAKSIQDYVTGVEVGMDTNARKNRSGKAMELILEPLLEKLYVETNVINVILKQQKYSTLSQYNVRVPIPVKDRKADFILVTNNNKAICIETNFYAGTGSKPQEIVDSYINRQKELNEFGHYFIWITDGGGWNKQQNQIEKGFNKLEYLLNLHFVRKGLLKEIVLKLCEGDEDEKQTNWF